MKIWKEDSGLWKPIKQERLLEKNQSGKVYRQRKKDAVKMKKTDILLRVSFITDCEVFINDFF